jgi:DNA-directed RNA polymerase subunit beta
VRTYNLIKFKRSNQGTCINQKPIVKKGERVEAAKSSPTAPPPTGEICAGPNVLVGFMTWEGYNYEDAI